MTTAFDSLQVHQSSMVPFGEMYLTERPGGEIILLVPRTRPTLRFPLTEQVALASGVRPWYWDVATWPFREPISAREYLEWIGI